MGSTSISHWRHQLKSGRQALRAKFERDNNAAQLLRGLCRLVDGVLSDIWAQSGLPPEICLIAVGGYGRGELFPHSDVDILILTPADKPEINATLESLVGIFWDIGLAIGHSVRTLPECLEAAQQDITVQTNLLEARRLAGSPRLFSGLLHQVRQRLNPQAFFRAKQQEQTSRHHRFNDTAYNLEPNIKEGPGGLRDLHSLLWIANGGGLGATWNALAKNGLLSSAESRLIRRHETRLQNLRIHLHYLTERREDRLLFDHQDTLARQLVKPKNNTKQRPSEQIMQHYYRSARVIRLMNEILLQSLEKRVFSHPENKPKKLDALFQIHENQLEACQLDIFEREPSAILQSFITLQQHPELTGFTPDTIRALWHAKRLVNAAFRRDPQLRAQFMQILRHPDGILRTLHRMHRYGILGRYIPAFGRITDQMQHDLFHVYTVDEHTLNVLRNVRRFAGEAHRHEFPLCSDLFRSFDQPELLYLAALFHDIAKGRGGDHSSLGAVDARKFCKQHGLDEAQTGLVAWLVQSHLSLSATAQQQDISDPDVVTAFSNKMGDVRHLTALYLLTVADIRGTSPNVWNAWKARLLESLYLSSRKHLQGMFITATSQIKLRQTEAHNILKHYGVSATACQPLWNTLDDDYFLRFEAKEIAWQTRLLLTHVNTTTPIVRTRLSPAGDGIQVMLYSHDQNNLFARICGFFDRLGHNIVEARIHTTRHGYALDSFLVLDENDRSVRYGDLIAYIERELAAELAQNNAPEPSLEGRISRQLKHFPFTPVVNIQAQEKDHLYTVSLVAGDRPGLLSRVAQTLLQHEVQLHSAKINTLGQRAEDSFMISSQRLNATSIKQLEQDLTAVLAN
ncbi:MAG: [protein-PII] uridylyltransferase [Methylophilaceae bacterium]